MTDLCSACGPAFSVGAVHRVCSKLHTSLRIATITLAHYQGTIRPIGDERRHCNQLQIALAQFLSAPRTPTL